MPKICSRRNNIDVVSRPVVLMTKVAIVEVYHGQTKDIIYINSLCYFCLTSDVTKQSPARARRRSEGTTCTCGFRVNLILIPGKQYLVHPLHDGSQLRLRHVNLSIDPNSSNFL